MFGKNMSLAMRAMNEWRTAAASRYRQVSRSRAGAPAMCTAAGAAAAGAVVTSPYYLGLAKGAALGLGSAAVMLGGGAVAVLASSKGKQEDVELLGENSSSSLPWVQELAGEASVEEVLSPGQMLRSHPVAKILVDQDHLFDTMVQSGQIREFRCFYDRELKQFHSVVNLGRDVCGYPQTVHGGLTAAIVDETLGGLGVCMWREGALGFRPPAYTARLEVDYKQKIPSGSVLLCSTEVERVDDRKIWMRAHVTNGNGVVYASARALFVAPRMQNVMLGWIPGFGKKK